MVRELHCTTKNERHNEVLRHWDSTSQQFMSDNKTKNSHFIFIIQYYDVVQKYKEGGLKDCKLLNSLFKGYLFHLREVASV
jgi:hypothetical protein